MDKVYAEVAGWDAIQLHRRPMERNQKAPSNISRRTQLLESRKSELKQRLVKNA
jgi:hypothetical protein